MLLFLHNHSISSSPGGGNILISAVSDGTVYNCHLSNVDRVSTFWKVMEQFCDNLSCCSNLISGFELQSTCPQCGRGPLSKNKDIAQSFRKRSSLDQTVKTSCVSSTPDSTAATIAEVPTARTSAPAESPKRRRIDSGNSFLSESIKMGRG